MIVLRNCFFVFDKVHLSCSLCFVCPGLWSMVWCRVRVICSVSRLSTLTDSVMSLRSLTHCLWMLPWVSLPPHSPMLTTWQSVNTTKKEIVLLCVLFFLSLYNYKYYYTWFYLSVKCCIVVMVSAMKRFSRSNRLAEILYIQKSIVISCTFFSHVNNVMMKTLTLLMFGPLKRSSG